MRPDRQWVDAMRANGLSDDERERPPGVACLAFAAAERDGLVRRRTSPVGTGSFAVKPAPDFPLA
jgi:hypothetical protein